MVRDCFLSDKLFSSHKKRRAFLLAVNFKSRSLEFRPEQLVGDFVMELNLWNLDDRT